MNLWNYLKNHIAEHKNSKICECSKELTFEETATWVEDFATQLNGVDICAILCSSEMAAAVSLLACFAAGVTAVPLSKRYGDTQCNKMLEMVNPDAVITDDDSEISVRKIKECKHEAPDEHPSLIMCTSGTTGMPKGIMLSDKNIISNISDITEYFAVGEKDTILISRPLYHCAVLTGEFLTGIVKGANICFYSGNFNPIRIFETIEKNGITAFCGTPTMLSVMARLMRRPSAETLRHICISGECMSAETGQQIRAAFPLARIYHVYGLTEAAPRVCFLPPELFDVYPDFVGIPLRSVYVKLMNKSGKECKEHEDGILYVKGDNVMLGYYKDKKRTHDVLKDGWLCTGDIAVINDAGLIRIKGRKDDLIIKAGMNIYPAEIEGAMKCDPRVKEVLAYGFPSRFGTQIGIKLVGDFSSVDDVKKLCIKCLPYYQMPTAIELTNKLSKNGSGKIIRNVFD